MPSMRKLKIKRNKAVARKLSTNRVAPPYKIEPAAKKSFMEVGSSIIQRNF